MAEDKTPTSETPNPSPQARGPRSAKKNALFVLLPLFLVLGAGIGLFFTASPPVEGPPAPLPREDGGMDGAASRGAAGTASFAVTVVDSAGEAIAGARLALTIRLQATPDSASTPRQSTTDAGGQGRFDALPAGQGTLLVYSEGHARGHLHVVFNDEAETEPTEVRVVLRPALQLVGRVLDDHGAPISDADVEVELSLGERFEGDLSADEELEPPPWSTRTNEDGDFSFDDLMEGPQSIVVTAEGFDRIARRVTPHPDSEPVTIVLRRTATIIGHVEGADGEGATGAEVVLAGSGVWPPRSTRTNEDGAYRFSGVPAGIYEVRASRGDEVATPREGLILEPATQTRVDLSLEEGASLRGVVVADGSGAPIVDAEVIIGEDALSFAPRAVTTEADGSFRFTGLRPLPHRVNVVANGYVSTGEAMHRPGGEPLRLVLEPAAAVSGQVIDALGHAVAGAMVEVVGTTRSGTPIALTATDVTFRAAHAHSLAEGPTAVGEGGELGVTLGAVPLIPLTRGETPTTAAAGTRTGARRGEDDAESTQTSHEGTFVTDEAGRFHVTGLLAGRYEVMGRHPRHAPGISTPFTLGPGQHITETLIELPAGAHVNGRVVDPRGFPVADVRVEMHCEREPFPRWALSSPDGAFEFSGARGRCVFGAHPAGLPAARVSLVVIGGEDLTVELALDDDVVTLYARIVDDADFPVAGARLTLRSLRADAPVRRTAFSSDDGTITMGGLPAPPWRVQVDQEGFALETVDVRPSRPRSTSDPGRERSEEHQITLRPAASVLGRIVDGWDGHPLPGATVTLRRGNGRELGGDVTNDDGIFEISRVPIGIYELLADSPGLLHHEQRVRLVARRPAIEDLDLEDIALSVGGSVRGEVVDGLGAPVGGAQVAAGPSPNWDTGVRTDAQGTFLMEGLPPGETTLAARHPGAGTSAAVGVRVRPREETPTPTLHLPERFDPERAATGQGATRQHNGVAVRLRESNGRVLIAAVLPQTYADGMGLRARDVLLSVDGEVVSSAAQATELLRGPVGTEALVEVRRRRDTMLLAITRESYQQ